MEAGQRTALAVPPPLLPHPDPHPGVPRRRRDCEGEERVAAGPEGGEAAELVEEAADPEGLEGEAAQHVEGVAEQQQPEAGKGPGEVLPDQQRREDQGHEGEVPLQAKHPGGQGAGALFPRAPDGHDLDRAAEQDGRRPSEQDARRAAALKAVGGGEGRRGEQGGPGEPGPGGSQEGPAGGPEEVPGRLEVVGAISAGPGG